MKALMSSWPRRGSCNEYCRNISGAASSSTMARSDFGPQKLVNQRPTMALFSCSLDIKFSFCSGYWRRAAWHSSLHLESYSDVRGGTLRILLLNPSKRWLTWPLITEQETGCYRCHATVSFNALAI